MSWHWRSDPGPRSRLQYALGWRNATAPCVRVREGGAVLQVLDLDRGCFACTLGGADNSTLFLVATEWRGPAGAVALSDHPMRLPPLRRS